MDLYTVRGWDAHYEKAQTRKVEKAQWVPIPVKHDGKGFRRLMALEDGAAIYGAWILILQVAAKCETRGVLQDEDGPLTAEDLALKTGCPEKTFSRALQVLSSQRIGWIVVADWESPDKSLQLQDRTGQDRTRQDRTGQDRSADAVCVEDTSERSSSPKRSPEILEVFDHYRSYHPKSHPSPSSKSKAWAKVRDRLAEGYTSSDLARAIDGCHESPWHCGINPSSTKYQALELIMRDSDQVAKFLEIAEHPPPSVLNEKTQRSLLAAESYLAKRAQDDEPEYSRTDG